MQARAGCIGTEIAAADFASGYRAGEFEDRIVGVDDRRHLTPLRDVLHRSSKLAAAADPRHG